MSVELAQWFYRRINRSLSAGRDHAALGSGDRSKVSFTHHATAHPISSVIISIYIDCMCVIYRYELNNIHVHVLYIYNLKLISGTKLSQCNIKSSVF